MASAFPYLKDGDALEPFHLNVIYRELERWRKFSAAPPLAISFASGPTPPVISGVDPGEGARYALTTSAISAATSPTTPGSGTAALQSFDGSTISAEGGPDVMVYNPTDKVIATNALVTAILVDGLYSVVTVYSCTQLS